MHCWNDTTVNFQNWVLRCVNPSIVRLLLNQLENRVIPESQDLQDSYLHLEGRK